MRPRAKQFAPAAQNGRRCLHEETAQAINDFLRNDVLSQASVFKQAGPGVKLDPDLKVRAALDRAAASISQRFQSRPLIESSIRQTIGESYQELGLYPESIAQLERALALRRANLGPEHSDTLETLQMQGHVLWLQAKYADAEQLFTSVLAARNRTLGENHPDTLLTMSSLAMLHVSRGEHSRAEPLLVKYLEGVRQLRGELHREPAQGMNDLASLYQAQGKYSAARAAFQEGAGDSGASSGRRESQRPSRP